VIPERIIFVSRGITVSGKHFNVTTDKRWITVFLFLPLDFGWLRGIHSLWGRVSCGAGLDVEIPSHGAHWLWGRVSCRAGLDVEIPSHGAHWLWGRVPCRAGLDVERPSHGAHWLWGRVSCRAGLDVERQPRCPLSARQGVPQSDLRFVFKGLNYYFIKLQSNLTGRNFDITHHR